MTVVGVTVAVPRGAPGSLHSPVVEIWPGQPQPLGATYDGAGTNFSVFSEVADAVELCLFDDDGVERRIELPEVAGFVHHGHVPGVQPGQRYGYRVHGPWAPAEGHRCNPHKLLIDPYAKAVEGEVDWHPAVFGADPDDPDGPASTLDSAPYVPRVVVANPYFDWGDDRHPRTPWHETLVYETHVRGLTMRHPDVPPELRGTYSGLGHPAVVDHLLRLGVTAVELLPIHQFLHDERLVAAGLRNYWGYNSIGFLAPHDAYASYGRRGQQVQELKQLVKVLHAAGIEVILDVVYNHTGEGDHRGPLLSLRGFDNAAYYRLDPTDLRRYVDYTGTGNSLNMRHPHVLQLIMDSLRYWVQDLHVDGFRFDLASTLARELHDVDKLSAFFDLIQQDPVISQVKLIAEPWDVGEGGYQVGNFPPLWSEWNGRYRDEVRDYWRGADHTVAEFGYRFTGSSDLYQANGRTPTASPWPTWWPTSTSTTRPTARPTATGATTTARGTAASRAPPTTRTCWPSGAASSATCWPRCCCPRACPCWPAATRSDAPRAATTTPTPRTTRCPGTTGSTPTSTCWTTPAGWSASATGTPSSDAASGSRGDPSWARRRSTSPGWPRTGRP